MASTNRLYRNFIILQEDERGYSNSEGKTLSGYSKIEAKGEKCKVSFYVQNLRKDISDKYYMILICCKKDNKQLINLGELPLTETGKGEVTKEYNIDNIAGLDLSYDKISGTSIMKIKEGIPICIMCGFLNGEQPLANWKDFKMIKGIDIKEKIADKIKEIKHEDKKKASKKEEASFKNEDKREEIKEKDIKKDSKEIVEEVEEIITDLPKENLRGKFEEYEDLIETNKEFNPNTSAIRGSIGEYFEGIVDGFERDNVGFQEIKYTKWYKIQVTDLFQMCNTTDNNKYTLAYYPMLNYYPYIKKYGYFMLGYKCNSKGELQYVVYGVPGKKDNDEQPYDGKTGFVTWVNKQDNDSVGCWLMFYDFKNSTVVVPMK